MDKFSNLIDELNKNIDVLRTRRIKTTDEYYDLIEENRLMLVTIEKLSKKITKLRNIEYVLTNSEQIKNLRGQVENKVAKMSFWLIVLLTGILVITTETLPFYIKDYPASVIALSKATLLGSIGAVAIGTTIGLTAFLLKNTKNTKI